jgi:hypothetical protein
MNGETPIIAFSSGSIGAQVHANELPRAFGVGEAIGDGGVGASEAADDLRAVFDFEGRWCRGGVLQFTSVGVFLQQDGKTARPA